MYILFLGITVRKSWVWGRRNETVMEIHALQIITLCFAYLIVVNYSSICIFLRDIIVLLDQLYNKMMTLSRELWQHVKVENLSRGSHTNQTWYQSSTSKNMTNSKDLPGPSNLYLKAKVVNWIISKTPSCYTRVESCTHWHMISKELFTNHWEWHSPDKGVKAMIGEMKFIIFSPS